MFVSERTFLSEPQFKFQNWREKPSHSRFSQISASLVPTFSLPIQTLTPFCKLHGGNVKPQPHGGSEAEVPYPVPHRSLLLGLQQRPARARGGPRRARRRHPPKEPWVQPTTSGQLGSLPQQTADPRFVPKLHQTRQRKCKT